MQDIKNFARHPIQLIVVGDFFQLPPVGGDAASRSINSAADAGARRESDGQPYSCFLEQCIVDAHVNWQKPFLPFSFKETKGKLAFQTVAWREANFTTCKLHRVFRTDSDVLLKGCSAMREGKADGPEIRALVGATSRPLPPKNGVVATSLMSTKGEVKARNDSELQHLDPLTEHLYVAVDRAHPDKSLRSVPEQEWAKRELMKDPMFTKEDECPGVEKLRLRLGAQVVLRASRASMCTQHSRMH